MDPQHRVLVLHSAPLRLNTLDQTAPRHTSREEEIYLHPGHEPLVLLQIPDHLPAARRLLVLPLLPAVHHHHRVHVHALHPQYTPFPKGPPKNAHYACI